MLFAIILFWLANADVYGQISVIVHKSVATDPINSSRLADIYTLNSQQWKDGSRIQVVDYKGTKALKLEFYKSMNLTPSDMQKIWLRKQFSGKAVPPATFSSEEEVVQKVVSTPGAIGYVSANIVHDSVRVIATIP
jgi:ABC-type phosphate transport system substrate-binding protein